MFYYSWRGSGMKCTPWSTVEVREAGFGRALSSENNEESREVWRNFRPEDAIVEGKEYIGNVIYSLSLCRNRPVGEV